MNKASSDIKERADQAVSELKGIPLPKPDVVLDQELIRITKENEDLRYQQQQLMLELQQQRLELDEKLRAERASCDKQKADELRISLLDAQLKTEKTKLGQQEKELAQLRQFKQIVEVNVPLEIKKISDDFSNQLR